MYWHLGNEPEVQNQDQQVFYLSLIHIWIMWTAAMSSDKETFQKFSDPVYKYINETVPRVPISDWRCV